MRYMKLVVSLVPGCSRLDRVQILHRNLQLYGFHTILEVKISILGENKHVTMVTTQHERAVS